MRFFPTKLEVALFLIDEKDEVEDRLTGSTILEAERILGNSYLPSDLFGANDNGSAKYCSST
jgi:hypothetical protein